MKKKRLILPCLMALLCGGMAHADTNAYAKTYVRQYGQSVTADGTANFVIGTTYTSEHGGNYPAEMAFDSEGNAVMTINKVVVAKVPVTTSGDGSLASGLACTGVSATTAPASKVTVTLNAGGYGTLYSPFQLVAPSTVKVYVPRYDSDAGLVRLNDDTRVQTSANILPVNTPVVITSGTPSGTVDFSFLPPGRLTCAPCCVVLKLKLLHPKGHWGQVPHDLD